MYNTVEQKTPKSHDELIQQAVDMVIQFEGLTGKYFIDEGASHTLMCQVNNMHFNSESHFVGGLILKIQTDERSRQIECRVGTFHATNPVMIEREKFDFAMEDAYGKYMSVFQRLSERGYLFKFEDNEGHKIDRIIPHINASRIHGEPVYLYYAPNPSVFRLVEILPEDVNIESTEDGVKVSSFSYIESQMTIEGNPYSSSDKSFRLYQFMPEKHVVSDMGNIPSDLKGNNLYLISRYHYQQILSLIVD